MIVGDVNSGLSLKIKNNSVKKLLSSQHVACEHLTKLLLAVPFIDIVKKSIDNISTQSITVTNTKLKSVYNQKLPVFIQSVMRKYKVLWEKTTFSLAEVNYLDGP